MTVLIRINTKIYEEATKVACAENRSISEQIELWAMIGKAVLDNPDLPTEFVRELLVAKRHDFAFIEEFHVKQR
jgi:hypothetical protein